MATSAESASDSYGRPEWTVLGILLALNYAFGAGLSLQGPFYPVEAGKKGASASVYGTVLGFYPFALLLFTPIVGSYMITGRLRIKNCFLYAYLIVGSCLIFYGLLDFIDSYTFFILTSFIIRALDGLGSSCISSSYIITNLVFSKRMALVLGLSESTYLLGMSTGPLLGELIFQRWGYIATFVVFGVFELSIVFITWYTIPDISKIPRSYIPFRVLVESFFKLFQIPAVILFLSTTIITAFGTAFISAVLEPNLRQFNLTNVEVGEMFMFMGAPQLLSPGWGFVVDRGLLRGEFVGLIGGIMGILGISLIGPLSFIPLTPAVTITAVGIALFGLGQGAMLASNFYNLNHGRRQAEVLGSNIAGVIWVAVYYVGGSSLGGWVGATMAGVLFDSFGFRIASIFLWTLYVIMCLLVLIFLLVNKSSQRAVLEAEVVDVDTRNDRGSEMENDETQPLMH